jgi:hypothetical protein
MFKMIIPFLFVFLSLRIDAVEKQQTLSICSLFRNQSSQLKEWIEYHLIVGVDHFYLYNLGSTDEFMNVLTPYISKGIVTLVNWPDSNPKIEENSVFQWSLGVQIPAYENAIRFLALHKTKWLALVDIHEFLVSPSADKIPDILKKYDDFSGVVVSCDFFDASRSRTQLPRRKLLIQTLEMTKPLLTHPHKAVEKMIFKPDHCKGFQWPPYQCIFKNLQVPKVVRKSELRINNYIHREEDFSIRRINRKMEIDNRHLSDDEMSSILSLDYEIEDHDRVIFRFIPELAKKMGYDLEWGW